MCFHFYADDTQIYLSFNPTCHTDIELCKEKLELCILDIRKWMARNFLKLNDDKTEMLIIQSKFQPNSSFPKLLVGHKEFGKSNEVRNIGTVWDSALGMETQISNIVQSAFMHLRNIWKIRQYLTRKATETIVHAFITSKLDYCNSLLYGLPQNLIQRLQRLPKCSSKSCYFDPKIQSYYSHSL